MRIIDTDRDDELICGSHVQVDMSGVGHCWRHVAAREMPAEIRDEIEAQMIDGCKEECGDWRASNGLHYRW